MSPCCDCDDDSYEFGEYLRERKELERLLCDSLRQLRLAGIKPRGRLAAWAKKRRMVDLARVWHGLERRKRKKRERELLKRFTPEEREILKKAYGIW